MDTALLAEDVLTPPPREVRSTDVSRLSVPIQMVLAIVCSALTVGGGIWATNAGLRSDVRDILTRMELQAKIDDAQTKAQDNQIQMMGESIAAMQRRLELVQLQYQELREQLINGRTR